MFSGNFMPMPMTASDVAAVTRNNDSNCNNNGDGYGYGAMWWIWIVIIVLFARGGFGNFGGNCGNGCGGGSVGAEVQRGFDTQSIISKLDGISNGICNLGYDQLSQMNGINTNILQTGFGIQQAINADTVANMQNTNALAAQFAQCCCDQKMGQMEIMNAMDKNNCATNNNIVQTGNALMQNQTQGFNMLAQTINQGFAGLELRQVMQENANLRQQLNDCSRDEALARNANCIINAVRPTPSPAYLTCNPNTGNWLPCNAQNIFGNYNNDCGCNQRCGMAC